MKIPSYFLNLFNGRLVLSYVNSRDAQKHIYIKKQGWIEINKRTYNKYKQFKKQWEENK